MRRRVIRFGRFGRFGPFWPFWGLAVPVAFGAFGGCAGVRGVLGIRERERPPFEHRAHVTRGIHCLSCHAGVATAGERGALHLPGDAKCLECHARPHDTRSCAGCHGRPETRERAELARKNLKFEHARHLPRMSGDCVRCHLNVAQDAEELRPPMATCLSCHEHRDQFAIRDCGGCHVDLPAEATRPESHLVHVGNWVREHGVRAAGAADLCSTCHQERFCAACHGVTVPALTERLLFDETLREGIHRAGFRSRHAEEARGDPGLCTTCHASESCADCHRRSGVAPGGEGRPHDPHPRGWIGLPGQSNDHGRAAWRDPPLCASCHGGAGESLCIGCHRPGGIGGGRWHAPGFSSRLDRNADAPCRLCHGAASP